MSFGNRLGQAMALEGVTQSDLERSTGIPQPTISRIVRGIHVPSITIAERLEIALPRLRALRDEELKHAS